MSRSPKRKDRAEGQAPVPRESLGRVTFLDPFGDPAFLPPADVNENAEGLVIRLEVPGVRGTEVAVYVQGNTIEVAGEKMRDLCGTDVSFLCIERTFGKFRRTFEVTGCVNMGAVKAELKKGVLALTIPRCDERRGKRRRIQVSAEEE
ncbi:MAG TPA: Hsp20/alpha crystallin family protein [Candidatus Deferrimicrobiaceae bacterium]|nr:Hsp20/alpha crystallin family protein [Candidatus Deferrimicrobiaceae bacterium]